MDIAICDDDIYTIGKLEMIISDYMKEQNTDYSIDSFNWGEELYDALVKNEIVYQIFFLDIEMGIMSGLKLASLIRERSNTPLIIFITGHPELMAEAFDVNAFHYIVKPFKEDIVKNILNKAISYLGVRKDIYQFKIKRKIHSIYLENIIYFECQNRKIIIYTNDHKISEYYGQLKEVKEKVNARLFVQIHPSFIVNMEYIKTLSNKTIVLTSGENLTITSKYMDGFNNSYRKFVLMRAL